MKSLFITGCSSGIGRATALHFAARGYRTLAGVRKAADGDALRAADSSGNLQPVLVDVTDTARIRALAAELDADLGAAGLDGLVNNAGFATGGPLEFLDPAAARQVLEVNVMGPLQVTQALLPLIRRARGRIVTVGSIGGKVVTPANGIYNMSKFAVEAFNDVLRLELAAQGISVSLIEPGPIATPMLNGVPAMVEEVTRAIPPEARELYRAQIDGTVRFFSRAASRALAPETVARVIQHALESPRPKTRYLVTTDAKLISFLRWLLPDRMFDRTSALLAR